MVSLEGDAAGSYRAEPREKNVSFSYSETYPAEQERARNRGRGELSDLDKHSRKFRLGKRVFLSPDHDGRTDVSYLEQQPHTHTHTRASCRSAATWRAAGQSHTIRTK